MGGRRKPKDKRLNEAALIAATGISKRKLTRRFYRWDQSLLTPRRGLGRDRGTTPHLAGTLGRFKAVTSQMKTLSDIETKIPANLWRPANLPRGHPLRTIFRGLSDADLRSLTTLLICVVLGIRLPMFDEPNPSPFKIFKRAFGLPKEWQMPPGLFDVFPYMHEQIKNALSAATADAASPILGVVEKARQESARHPCLFQFAGPSARL
jgi:hypothetical protein